MKTISQIAALTGVSIRTLQYYDEINLLKPSELTLSGYRLYDDEALERLQQILFFKELGFRLKDIKVILEAPEFDKLEAFHKQKQMLLLKRARMDRLIKLLGRLEKGEQCMSFQEFDMSEYIAALENFKCQNTDDVIKHWGSIEKFEEFIQKARDGESRIAECAIRQYGSIEKYTEAMKYNLEHFSELMERADQLKANIGEVVQKSDDLYTELTADLTREVSSCEIQGLVYQIVEQAKETSLGVDMGEFFWDMVIESYSDDTVRGFTEQKYGAGASDYIVKALRYYFSRH